MGTTVYPFFPFVRVRLYQQIAWDAKCLAAEHSSLDHGLSEYFIPSSSYTCTLPKGVDKQPVLV